MLQDASTLMGGQLHLGLFQEGDRVVFRRVHLGEYLTCRWLNTLVY
jgi:hypothetical protein